MDRKACRNGFSVRTARNRSRDATSAQPGQPQGVGKTLLRSSSPIWIAPFKSTAERYSTP